MWSPISRNKSNLILSGKNISLTFFLSVFPQFGNISPGLSVKLQSQ